MAAWVRVRVRLRAMCDLPVPGGPMRSGPPYSGMKRKVASLPERIARVARSYTS
jgi:hypothetical protein